jgi:hypothetical protein
MPCPIVEDRLTWVGALTRHRTLNARRIHDPAGVDQPASWRA